MKFLIDLCAGRRVAEWLRSEGYDVKETRDHGLDPGDEALLEWAAGEQRVLITMDKDFGELIFFRGFRHAGLIRLPDVSAESRIALMRQVLKEHGNDVADGVIITVRGGRIRISRSQ